MNAVMCMITRFIHPIRAKKDYLMTQTGKNISLRSLALLQYLVDIHVLLDLLALLHIDIVLLGLLLLGRRRGLGLGSLGLGPVHEPGRGELDVIPTRQDLGGLDDGVDVLASLGLTDEVVLEPLLVGGALLDLSGRNRARFCCGQLRFILTYTSCDLILTTFSLSASVMCEYFSSPL